MTWTPIPSAAELARTVLALAGPASWGLETSGSVLVAPFVAVGVTPLLRVERERTDDLLGQQSVAGTLASGLGLATLTLVDRPRPPRPHERVRELPPHRHDHAGCGPACGTTGLPVALGAGTRAAPAAGPPVEAPAGLTARASACQRGQVRALTRARAPSGGR